MSRRDARWRDAEALFRPAVVVERRRIKPARLPANRRGRVQPPRLPYDDDGTPFCTWCAAGPVTLDPFHSYDTCTVRPQ